MKTEKYDSTPDTKAHIQRVAELLIGCGQLLEHRARVHDASKLQSPEKEIFDEMTPKLKDSTYGSEEYKGFLTQMRPALDHHYANNSHHPEHYGSLVCDQCFTEHPKDHEGQCVTCGSGWLKLEPNISGMSLLDLLEMLCDWHAAGERHADGSMARSLRVNRERFKIGDQLQSILENTVGELERVQKGDFSPSTGHPDKILLTCTAMIPGVNVPGEVKFICGNLTEIEDALKSVPWALKRWIRKEGQDRPQESPSEYVVNAATGHGGDGTTTPTNRAKTGRWNYEPAQAWCGTVVVGKSPQPTWWCAGLEGSRRRCLKVQSWGEAFYLDDEDGSGSRKVFELGGGPDSPISHIPVDDESTFEPVPWKP